jgi:hypothetical protein
MIPRKKALTPDHLLGCSTITHFPLSSLPGVPLWPYGFINERDRGERIKPGVSVRSVWGSEILCTMVMGPGDVGARGRSLHSVESLLTI